MKNKLFMTSMTTIIGLYGVLILFLLILFNIFEWPLYYLLITSVVFLLLQFLLSPIFMDITMKFLYKAKFDAGIPDYLVKFVNEVCKNNNMKYPKIGLINDGAPNAFTYGRTKNDARVVITRGILELLTEEEVKTVVGHELGHAVHYDMALMTAAQLVPLVLYYIYDITIRSNNNDNDKGYGALIGAIAYILYIVTEYVILWFSRTREYYADEFAVEATKNPDAMASALVKVGFGLTTNVETTTDKKGNKVVKKSNVSSVAALGIFDKKASKSLAVTSYNNGKLDKNNIKKAARWELWNPWAKWYEFNSTHPLISKRIKAISNMSEKYNQKPYITFDEKQPESYVDDFIVEVFINFLPTLILIIGLVFGIIFYEESELIITFIGIVLTLLGITKFIKLNRRYKNADYTDYTVSELLGEVKVSNVTSIPCTLNGTIIGRGDPGYMFSEDYVIKDSTGIIFADYNQPLYIINKLHALFKSQNDIDNEAKITGWYRRSPVPYVEIRTLEVNGKVKKIHTYGLKKALIITIIVVGVFLIIMGVA